MALGRKSLIDSTNASALADVWAEALEHEVEDSRSPIEQLSAAGHIGEEAVVEHGGHLRLDVHSEPGGLGKLVARLEELEATRVREVDKGPAGHWWIMQDPDGNEFCAAQVGPRAASTAGTTPRRHVRSAAHGHARRSGGARRCSPSTGRDGTGTAAVRAGERGLCPVRSTGGPRRPQPSVGAASRVTRRHMAVELDGFP